MDEQPPVASSRSQLQPVQRIIMVTLIIVLLIIGSTLLTRSHNAANQKSAKDTAESVVKKPSAASNGKSSSTNLTSVSTQPKSNSQLNNTGPGSTVAIFVGATLVGASIHHLYLRRRLQPTKGH